MPLGEVKLTDLHLATSMGLLNDLVDPGDKIKNSNPSSINSSLLNKLYDNADKAFRIEKDDELAYVLYMRFLHTLQQYAHPDRNKYKVKSGQAILIAEEIGKRLPKRYEMAKERAAADAKGKELELLDAHKNLSKRGEPSKGLGGLNGIIPAVHHELEVTPEMLKNLIDQKSTRFLIIDTRSTSDFTSSHPKHVDAICISNVFLVKGVSANKLTQKLMQSNSDSLELWNRRATFDLIVIYDWNTTFEEREPASPLSVLYEVITQWDINTKYKGKVVILQGGFRQFYRKYPTYCTGLCTINGQLDEMVPKSSAGFPLSEIAYPSLDDPPPPAPPLAISVKPFITNGEHEVSVTQKPKSTVTNPTINRTTKPVNIGLGEPESKLQPIPTSVSFPQAHEPLQPKPMETPIAEVHVPPSKPLPPSPSLKPKLSEKPLPPPSALKPQPSSTVANDEESAGVAPKPTKPEVNGVMDSPTKHIYTEKLKTDGEQRFTSNLKRSQSNPNLNTLQTPLDEAPTYNRTMKPQTRRDFPIVSVSSTMRHHRTGLKNLGNTCYMNTIIQCLSHTRDLAEFLTSDVQKGFGEVTKEVAMTIRQLSRGARSFAPEEIRRMIGRKHAPFAIPNMQHDSHELLTFLLDWMHEELNKAPRRNHKLMEQKNENVEMEVAYDKFRNDYLSVNNSIISNLFAGEQVSAIRCLKCSKQSVTFEPFYCLSIPIPSDLTNGSSTLDKCLDLYTTTEQLDMVCTQCKSEGQTIKCIELWRMPRYLLIHLQRFSQAGEHNGNLQKKFIEVVSPLDNLDITQRVKGPTTPTSTRYQLYAISNHYGTMGSGHYTAFCRNPESWTKFDDADTSLISSREISARSAYILFYQAREDD